MKKSIKFRTGMYNQFTGEISVTILEENGKETNRFLCNNTLPEYEDNASNSIALAMDLLCKENIPIGTTFNITIETE